MVEYSMSNNQTLNYYENNAQALSQRYESANIGEVHKLLLDTFPTHAHLLEIGCGSGRDASFLYEQGYSIEAIDGSKEMIKEAKILHPELANSFVVKRVPEALDFENESFDGVYSIATLMHFEKDVLDHTLKKISHLLKPTGKFLFSVSIQRNNQDDERYFNTMSKEEWIALCEKDGFKLVYFERNDDGMDRIGIIWLTCIMRKEV